VLAVRDLAGPAWLDASGDDPDVAAFTSWKPPPARQMRPGSSTSTSSLPGLDTRRPDVNYVTLAARVLCAP